MKAGAFGNWRKFNENFDSSIVKPTSERGVSCVSAVGEMLLRSRNISVTQAEILAMIGEPAPIESLERCLNKFDIFGKGRWFAGYETDVRFIIERKNFGVTLKEFGSQAHAVFVEEFNGRFIINDTFDQSYYEMATSDFINVWAGGYIFYEKNK
jgi:hypothetical protein